MNLDATIKNNKLIYLHIKLDSGEPFYIGMGTKKRMNTSSSRSKMWNYIVNKHGYDIIILEDNLTNEIAIEKEKYWIKKIGRRNLKLGPLINFTNGGEGIDGYKHTEISKKNMSNKHRGKIISESTKLKMSLSKKGDNRGLFGEKHGMFGKKHSDKSKEQMSIVKIGKNTGKNHHTYVEIVVYQYDKYNNFIKKWNNHHDAIDYYSFNSRSFMLHLNNKKYKTQGNFIWKSI